ncbi:MAG TPA: DUF481 domain-containing protein [Rhodanobacteraceae bacterium]|nr:DUF481 domain-containing protein [Rhodanobacteraceae bacterium]
MRLIAPVLSSLALLLPLAASAAVVSSADTGWQGTGELGFALSRGNTRSESLNAKLAFSKENAMWKDDFYISALRNKGTVYVSTVVDGQTVSAQAYQSTADRIESGASMGYKLSLRSYIVGALRYERDQFAAYRWQAAASIGYGYIMIKDRYTELSFELGPGYKRVQPVDTLAYVGDPPVLVAQPQASQGQMIVRGLMNFKHQLTDTASIQDKFLTESGRDNTYYENNASFVVDISAKLALKLSYQVRHNSTIALGSKHTDTLLTTNLVYDF